MADRGDYRRNTELVRYEAGRFRGDVNAPLPDYLVDALTAAGSPRIRDQPRAGTTPICCSRPRVSHTSHVSAILPSAMRWIVIASTRIGLPVGGTPFSSPTWLPEPVHR